MIGRFQNGGIREILLGPEKNSHLFFSLYFVEEGYLLQVRHSSKDENTQKNYTQHCALRALK